MINETIIYLKRIIHNVGTSYNPAMENMGAAEDRARLRFEITDVLCGNIPRRLAGKSDTTTGYIIEKQL